MKRCVQSFPIGFQNFHQGICHIIECQVFLPVGVIGSIVLQYNGIGQLVVGQELAVPVTDIPSGALDGTRFCGAQIKVVGVFVALNDLKLKKMLYQDKEHENERQKQHCGTFDTNFFKKVFYFLSQIESLSFISSSVSRLLMLKSNL